MDETNFLPIFHIIQQKTVSSRCWGVSWIRFRWILHLPLDRQSYWGLWSGMGGHLRNVIGPNHCGPHLEFCELVPKWSDTLPFQIPIGKVRQTWITSNICCCGYWERQTKGLSDDLNLEVGSFDRKLGFHSSAKDICSVSFDKLKGIFVMTQK